MIRPGHRLALIGLGALVLLNVAVYFTFTLPRSLQQRNLDQRLTTARADVAVERTRMEALRKHFEVINENSRDTTEFFSRRIGRRDDVLVPLLREVQAMATAHGLKLGTQGFEFRPVKGLDVEQLEIHMPVRGSYRAVMGFVEELERSPRFVTLDQVTAHKQEQDAVELQMTLSGYFRSAPGRPEA